MHCESIQEIPVQQTPETPRRKSSKHPIIHSSPLLGSESCVQSLKDAPLDLFWPGRLFSSAISHRLVILCPFRRRLTTPALRRSLLLLLLLLQWDTSARAISLHSLHIRAGLERLGKIADIADDICVTFEGQGNYRLVGESVVCSPPREKEDRACGGHLQQSRR